MTDAMLNSEAVNDALLAIGILELFDAGKQEGFFTNGRSLQLSWDTYGFLLRDYLKNKLGEEFPVLKRRRSMSRNYLRYEVNPRLRGFNFRNLQANIDSMRARYNNGRWDNLEMEHAGEWLLAAELLPQIDPAQDSDTLPGVGRDWRNYEINVENFLTSAHSVHPVMMLNRLADEIKAKSAAANVVQRYTEQVSGIGMTLREERHRRERQRLEEQRRNADPRGRPDRTPREEGWIYTQPDRPRLQETERMPEQTPQIEEVLVHNIQLDDEAIQELLRNAQVNGVNITTNAVREEVRPVTEEDIRNAIRQFEILAENHRR